jgi:ribosomal protein L39E
MSSSKKSSFPGEVHFIIKDHVTVDFLEADILLKQLKDSNPIQLAEYAVANRIQEEPAFKWWVSDTLRTQHRIIAKAKRRYWKTNHKYDVRLPHLVQEVLQINKETGTDVWWRAILKEMKKVMVAFEHDNQLTPEQA